ncbi:TIM44-like domain-containing protein [uncultured Ruminococcus sp.]|uniref:TIM44-like domain-containing protein n=1 Tax=uncultured Ruminococcus sp. TaxID=165186 RepID=UPI00261071F7|nr:TIM44-like domain-containing protein [uncultured Ruminococcus sp.]
MLGIIIVPLKTRALDFGNVAGDEDFSYDSEWEVEERTTAAHYEGSSDSNGLDGCFDCDGCTFFNSKSEMKFWLLAILAAIIVIIIGVALSSLRDSIRNAINYHRKPKPEPEPEPVKMKDDANKLRPISEYLTVDSGFSPADFKEKLSNLYIRLQDNWQAKDISGLRPYMTDAFYAQMKRELEQLTKAGQTNYIQRPSVLGTTLLGWRQDGGKDIIIAQLRTRMVNFIKDDVTGAIVRGSNTREKFMTYEWTLTRTTGVKTADSVGLTVHTCPGCGAKVDINQSAECPYCGAVLGTDHFDWILTGMNIYPVTRDEDNIWKR